jgi:hypothetical protein
MAAGIPPDLIALSKVWGVSPSHWMHGGVHQDNVGIWKTPPGGTPFKIKYNGSTWTQDALLWTRLTGDDYSAAKDPYGVACPAPDGLIQIKVHANQPAACQGCDVSKGQVMTGVPEACSNAYVQNCGLARPLHPSDMGPYNATTLPWDASAPNGYTNVKGRVGGVFATRDMYGPGAFSVLINLAPCAVPEGSPNVAAGFPRVSPDGTVFPYSGPDGLPGGRGPVFAMWTFGYNEGYQVPDTTATQSPDAGFASTCANPSEPTTDRTGAACGLQQQPLLSQQRTNGVLGSGVVQFPQVPGLLSADNTADNGFESTHNHEIDIEIPANSQQFQGAAMTSTLGWNTANFNTWLTDTDQYSAGATALYQQAQCTAPAGKYFAAVGPDDDQDTYHLLTIVWHVAPDNSSAASYVAFLVDGTEVYRTHQYVPRRSGRVLIGLWPAWWGTNYYPMDHNQVYAKIARMEFVPQVAPDGSPLPGLVTSGGQMYDQELPVMVGTPTPLLGNGANCAGALGPLTSSQSVIACGLSYDLDVQGVQLCPPSTDASWMAVCPPGQTPAKPCSPVNGPPSDTVPTWAIAVIAVLAVLLVVGLAVGGYFVHRHLTRGGSKPSTQAPPAAVASSVPQ